jgi:4-hydroxybenzoate polyprenyltransferase
MNAFFKLIRWKNILVVSLTMFAMKYAIIEPVYTFYGLEIGLSKLGFMFLVAAAMFLMAGGNVINDYFDRKADMINRPKKVLVGFQIKRRKVIFLHFMLNIFGVICGFIAAWFTGKIWLGFFFVIIAALLWSYSSKLKKRLLAGNLIVAFLTAVIPFIVGLTEYYAFERSIPEWTINSVHAIKISIQTIIGFSIFSFLFNFILEIIKDCADYDGDIETEVKSIPIVFGKKKTNIIISFLSFLSIGLILIVWHGYFSHLLFFDHEIISNFYIYSMIIFPIAIIAFSSLWGIKKKKYSILANLTKFVMVTGVLFSIIFSFAVYGSI